MPSHLPQKTPRILLLVLAAGAIVLRGLRADETTSPLQFERDVRPILKAHCFHCHGEGERPEGGLDVRLRRLLATGGDGGPALSPGNPDDSLLVQRVESGEMPPAEIEKRPTAAEIAKLRAWIAAGAATSGPEPENVGTGLLITAEERSHWSFQPIQGNPPPVVRAAERVRTPIDAYILQRLEQEGRTFSPPADRATWLRRVTFDLLGLPPTAEESRDFLADETPDAYERVVDRLLGSSAFGERWGRHWLDTAGYSDSDGRSVDDPPRPDAWRYRDYVIRAHNADKPFDEFVIEQLAGDELVRPPYYSLDEQGLDRLIATGFLRTAPDGTAQKDIDQGVERNQVVADTLEIVSTSLLGLTVACAQCHHHRYDPISQQDYYRLRAIFEPALDWRQWRTPDERRVSLYSPDERRRAEEIEAEAKRIDLERTTRQAQEVARIFELELAKLPEELRETVRAARDTPEKRRTAEQQKLLREHPSVNVSAGAIDLYDRQAANELAELAKRAAELRTTKPEVRYVSALCEPEEATPPETFLFRRGDHEQPDDAPLAPGELSVLGGPDILADSPDLPTTGRRLAYARWLTSDEHPLLARVTVNRIWLHCFGRGLVDTPADFGLLGEEPSHPELLDHLAARLRDDGWRLKPLLRVIVTSEVYRQGSARIDDWDPDNRLLGRMSVRRLDAEALRDGMLAASGALNRRAEGPPVPVMADVVGQWVIGIENLNAGRPGPVLPMHGEDLRRSVYVQQRRSRPLAVLDSFDLPAMTPNCVRRASSTVATQSLLLLNGPEVVEHGRRLAGRIAAAAGEAPAARATAAYWSAFSAAPSDEELAEAVAFLNETTAAGAAADEALALLCQALLSSNRFLYLD